MICSKEGWLALLVGMTALLSCSSNGSQKALPALLDEPSKETRLALEKALGSLLNSDPIKLSDNAFVNKHTVIVDQIKSTNNAPLSNGRDLREAHTFSLVTQKEKCWVRHNQSGEVLLLHSVKCSAL